MNDTKRLKLNVIGDPIAHSKSPIVHGIVMRELYIDCEYDKVLVRRGELGEYIKKATAEGVSGFNLTMPHKVDIIPYLESIDEDARMFGAVNTVKIKDGKLYGYNTDAAGFVLALGANGVSPKGKSIVILGAGGVVSTLALKLAAEGAAAITLLNRTVPKAEAIISSLRDAEAAGFIPAGCRTDCDTNADIGSHLADCDILINATPLGMTGVEGDYENTGFFGSLKKTAFVADLIYSPPKTTFLRAAETQGCAYMNGLGMLIGQAIVADEIYLDKKLDVRGLYTKIVSSDCEI